MGGRGGREVEEPKVDSEMIPLFCGGCPWRGGRREIGEAGHRLQGWPAPVFDCCFNARIYAFSELR